MDSSWVPRDFILLDLELEVPPSTSMMDLGNLMSAGQAVHTQRGLTTGITWGFYEQRRWV